MLRRVGSSLTCGLCLISLCAIARPALAQTLTDEHAWTGVALQGRLAKASPWRWLAEGQLRTRNESRDEDQLIERAALSRDLPAHVNLSLGYVRVGTRTDAGGVLHENRIVEQLTWGAGAISLRTRVEERSIENNSGTSMRVRQQLRYSRPLSAGGRTSFVGWDEASFHANTTTRNARGFDQNRAFAGIGRPLGGLARLEIGYLNQYLRSRTAPNHLNHVLSAIVTLAF